MSTKALVTGANGHIGGQVVRAVRDAGWTPIAFVRADSDRRALAGLDVEVRTGDLRDAASVERATAGCELVFHVGAVHRNFAVDPDDIVLPAIEGTRHVLAAARQHGVRRLVYCSTGATVGFTRDPARPLDEGHFLTSPRSAYIRGKVRAEELVRAAAAEPGAPEIVILNPSGVFGPGDYRLTPATRAIVGLLQGDPAFLHLCMTDVRDVATAHVLAAQRGRPGERYLITGEPVAPAALAALVRELSGARPPQVRPPALVLRALGAVAKLRARRTGADTPFDVDAVADLAGGHLVYDSTKSRTELGVTYRPPREVLTDALRWLLHVGALRPKVAARLRQHLGPRAAPDPTWAPA